MSVEDTVNDNGHKQLTITLKYVDGLPVVRKITRYSKPSLRKYTSAEDIPMVLDGLGVSIISTNQGVVPDYKAKQLNVGGEVICQVE
jgi:small subunit ribosomal protein S8